MTQLRRARDFQQQAALVAPADSTKQEVDKSGNETDIVIHVFNESSVLAVVTVCT